MQLEDIHAAEPHSSRLAEEAAAGQEIVIAKAGRPIARLVPLALSRSRHVPGALHGQLAIPDDFDAPLFETV